MPKTKTAPAPAPAPWTTEHAKLAHERLVALTGKAARTTRDVVNPRHDRRVKYGSDLAAAPEVIAAGTLVTVEEVRSGWILGVGGVRVEFRLVQIDDVRTTVVPCGGDDATDAVIRALLDALGEPEPSWEALCAIRSVWGYGGWAKRTLRHLVTSGRLTLDEVEAAALAADAEDAASDE